MTLSVLHLVFFALISGFSDAEFPVKLPEYLYELCNVTYINCLTGGALQDEECLNHKNCTTMVAFQENQDLSHTFWTMTQLTGDVAYVALGFSSDDKMGDDGVIECIQEKEGESPNVYFSYTKRNHEGVVRLDDMQANSTNGMASNGYLYCSYVLPTSLNFGNFNISLKGDQEYYVFGVAGKATMDGQNVIGIGYHSASELISDKTFFKEKNSGHSLSAYFSLISVLLIFLIKI